MLTLDDPDIDRMAHELAARTGQGVAGAVKAALAAQLAALPPKERRVVDLTALRKLQDEIRGLNTEGLTSDHSDLYDENGLPV